MTPRCPGQPLLGALLALGCQAALPTTTAATGGRVAVALAQKQYVEGDAVSATVRNGLEVALYTEDSKSDCSIVMVERQQGTSWQPVPGCSVERIPAVITIQPGAERSVRIDPLSFHLGVPSGSDRPALGAGTYRLRFSYRLQREPLGSEPETVLSETFNVRR